MHTPQELEKKFWKLLKSDMVVMIGLEGAEDGHTRPMTAQMEDEGHGPIWFFTTTDNRLAQRVGTPQRAIATFCAKGHDLFASVNGMLVEHTDREVVDRLWNPYLAAWYEGGMEDPRLALLRFDAEHAEIWLNENPMLAGVKLMLGMDPKKHYRDRMAEVNLRH